MIAPATRRGGGWVVAQFGLMALIVVAAFLPPNWPTAVRFSLGVTGGVLIAVGITFALSAARALGRSFTPFPSPTSAGTLVDRGPFRVVRHPIYSGGLLVFAGVSLATSLPALVGTAALACVWVGKLRVEEIHLRATYAGYEAYAQVVRFRLVPGLY